MTSEPPLPPPSREPPVPLPSRPELPEGISRPEPPAGRHSEQLPNWPAWTPLPALLLTFLTALVGTLAIVVVVELAGMEVDSNDLPPGVTIGGTIVQDFALVGSAVLFARVWAGGVSAADFGIRRTRLGPAIGWTALTWFSYLAFSAAWAAIFDITESDNLPAELGADESTLALIAVAFLVTLVAPIAEELFFRGFCFTAVRRALGVAGSAIVTGVIFGLIHAGGTEPEFLVPLGVLGALLCLLYWRTGSIVPCMVLHAINNSIALGVALEWQPVAIVATMAATSLLIVAAALTLSRPSAPDTALAT
jgi:membrane protease YdiL (CAAX protease family)